jgi:hypothetical protein
MVRNEVIQMLSETLWINTFRMRIGRQWEVSIWTTKEILLVINRGETQELAPNEEHFAAAAWAADTLEPKEQVWTRTHWM